MTQTASTARWRPRARSRWVALACKALLLFVGVLLAAQYLAGFLFLQWVHSDPKTATPLTVARYGYYFGEIKVAPDNADRVYVLGVPQAEVDLVVSPAPRAGWKT